MIGLPELEEIRLEFTAQKLSEMLAEARKQGVLAERKVWRERTNDPLKADWYWRDLDPDDSGDSIHEAIRMLGEGVVCHVRSSFLGPDFFAAIVPTLDDNSTEEIVADTEDECTRLVKQRYAVIGARSENND
jgi:hypothetical protein